MTGLGSHYWHHERWQEHNRTVLGNNTFLTVLLLKNISCFYSTVHLVLFPKRITLFVSFSDEWKNRVFGKRIVGKKTLAASRGSDGTEATRKQPPGGDPPLRPRSAHGCVRPPGPTLFLWLHFLERFQGAFICPQLFILKTRQCRKIEKIVQRMYMCHSSGPASC